MDGLFEYNDILLSPYEAFTDARLNERDLVKSHWHYYTEIIYLLSGKAKVTCDQESKIVGKGDLVLFFPRAIHSIETMDSEPLRYHVLKFDINKLNATSSYTPRLSSVFQAAREKTSGFFFAEEINGLPIEYIARDCIEEYEKRLYGYDLLMQSSLTSLLVLLLRVWKSRGLDTDRIPFEKSEDHSIYTITEYIDEHSGDLIHIQDLARKCGMSYSYFAREFKRLYGRSCKEYIEFIKICKVENMLRFTDFDLEYISRETGFSDSSHLIKVFKKQKGVTPKQFRKQKSN